MATTQPNILLILDDQHRIDCLGSYGNREVRTPYLDGLAAGGIRFENSFCAYPVCTPSRYSIVTGLYVHEHRGWTNRCTLLPEHAAQTFPALLWKAGYRTQAVGKMHYTPTYLDVGFERMVLAEQNGPGRWDDDYHRHLRGLGLVDVNDLEDQEKEFREPARDAYWETFGALVSNLPEEHHSTTWIGDRAVEALETWTGAGNLLVASFIKPHHPFDPPRPWFEMYDPEQIALLPGWTEACPPRDLAAGRGYFDFEKLTEPAARRAMAAYYAAISQIDHQVGRMLEVLRRKELSENTLILFTSDHGDYMGYHHRLLKGNTMYEPLIKVPLILRLPGGAGAGTVREDLVSNVDLAPTILRVAGCDAPGAMRGVDLAAGESGREVVFAEDRGCQQAMARTRTHKLILAQPREQSVLFDLEKDPHELENLFENPDCQQIARDLEAAIADWRGSGDISEPYVDADAPQIAQPNVPPDRSHRAEIIKYYQEKMAGVLPAG